MQFNPGTGSNLPSSITTVEALAVWALTVLNNSYPDLKVVEAIDDEGQDVEVRAVEANTFYITASETPTWRYLARLSVPLRKEFQQSGKIWEHVRILGDDAIPPAMKS